LFSGKLFQPSPMFAGKAGVYLSGEPEMFLTLPTNIRLGRQSLPGTNTLAYYKNSYIVNNIIYNIGRGQVT
jgi:hypothetical protein